MRPSVRAHLDVIVQSVEWLMDLTGSKCMVLLDIDSVDTIEGRVIKNEGNTIFIDPILVIVNRDDEE